MSWWTLPMDREQFAAEIARRFALNKPETEIRSYAKAERRIEKGAKGGRAKARRFGVTTRHEGSRG
ncbi:MAG TPA: hypothetical protein VNL98_07070 [Gemmatimonadales bacterium]|nr:hypothetical protein [Gemmatimonadales bacterium]